ALSVGKLRPFTLEVLVAPDLRGVDKAVACCADSGVGHANLACDLTVAQRRVLAQHPFDHLLLLLRRELAAVHVRADDPRLSFSKRPFPLHEVIHAKLMTTCLRCCVPVPAIEDHPLTEADWLKDALRRDVTL